MPLTAERLERDFALLEAAAASGARCPQNVPFGPLAAGASTQLARAGRIKVELYVHNWRVVTILDGPHKGRSTQPCPYGGSEKPYKVIEKDSAPPISQRRQPWSPVAALKERADR